MAELLRIEALGAQGDGVTPDGIFVPGALPGESVHARVSGHRADLLEVVQAAADRQQPLCQHFGSCGGCCLQHASDGLIEVWKQGLVRRALISRGIEGVEIRRTLTSPERSRRRVTLSGRRTKKGHILGFHAVGSDEIISLEDCTVATPAIMSSLAALGRILEVGASRKGALRLGVTDTPAGLDIAVNGGKPLAGSLYGELVAIAATSDLARLSWDGDVVVTRRRPKLEMGEARVTPPPGAFLQATLAGERALVAGVIEATAGARRIADLFSGIGTFSLPLAKSAEVNAYESDPDAVEALNAAWRGGNGMKPLAAVTRDLFRRPLLVRDLTKTDAVVIDPPRQGGRAQCEQLAQSAVKLIASISCNPATFARDARILIDGGYDLLWVQPVDQFRWTAHVELVAAFARR